MIDAPKTTLLNNIDDLDIEFVEGENIVEFEIDDYSFSVTYRLEDDDSDFYNEIDDEPNGTKRLTVISINAYDNIEDEDINVLVDDDIQQLFSNYWKNNSFWV